MRLLPNDVETPRGIKFCNNRTVTVSMEQAKLPRRWEIIYSPKYEFVNNPFFPACEARILKVANKKLLFELPKRHSEFDVGVEILCCFNYKPGMDC